MKVNCYHNEQWPIIATASRADLIADNSNLITNNPNYYPLVHAVCKIHEWENGCKQFYIEFEGFENENTNEQIKLDISFELMKFVCDEWDQKWLFRIKGEFVKVSDMSDTVLKKKYFILPAIESKKNVR